MRNRAGKVDRVIRDCTGLIVQRAGQEMLPGEDLKIHRSAHPRFKSRISTAFIVLLFGAGGTGVHAQTNMNINVSGGGNLSYTVASSLAGSCPVSYPPGQGTASQNVTATTYSNFAFNGISIGNGPTYLSESAPNPSCPNGWRPSNFPMPMSAQSNGSTYYILFTPPTAPNFTAPGAASLDSLGLTASPSPGTWGSTVQIMATETFPNLSGTVTFKDGAATLGTATMSNSVATYSTSSLSVGTHSFTASFTSMAGTDISPAITLTVNKATPVISWSMPSAITYGTALSGAQLNASANVPGTFSYSPANGAVLPAGTQNLTLTFTPTDTIDYNNKTAAVSLTVNQATPTISWSAPGPITYGTALSSAQLNATASVPGSFSYSPDAGAVLPVGTNVLSATFTPSDTSNYRSRSTTVSLTVNMATPSLNWSPPGPITYGTALSSAQLNASANITGSFSYSPPAGVVLPVATVTLSTTFTPTDTAHYKTASSTVNLTVTQATPTISWSAPAAIIYGTALSGTQLNASGSVAGSLSYSPAIGAVLTAGAQTLTANLTPSDSVDYKSASKTVSLTVNQATPTISWSAPAAIIYGTALSSTQLNASGSVAGSLSYSPAIGAVLTAGAQTLTANLTPSDSVDYKSASKTVSLTVTKAAPTISTWPTASVITYGQTLALSTLSGGSGSVAGSFSWLTSTTAPAAGTAGQGVRFSPTDTSNYNPITGSVNVTVNKANPAVSTWPAASAIFYGQTLASSTLTGGSGSVAGGFRWTNSTTAPGTGTTSQSVTFAPTDSADYNPATGSVSLTVNKATPTINWSNPARVSNGTFLSSVQLNATASVPGSITYVPSAGSQLTMGTQSLTANLTPTDTVNYVPVSRTVQVSVSMAPSAGMIATVAGNNIDGYTGDEGIATNAELSGSYGAAVDSLGNLYIADSGNGVIRKVAAATGVITTFAGASCATTSTNGTCGYGGDNGPATAAKLSYPVAVATDGAGNLFIADQDNCAIRKVDGLTGTISTIAGTGTCGFSGDGLAKSALLRYPKGVAVDSAGNVFIADTFNHAIRKVSVSSGMISTVAGTGGVIGYRGDGSAAIGANLSLPGGVAVDGAGNIYIADAQNSAIRKVTASSGVINTIAGNGTYGYSGDGGPAAAAVLDYPDSIVLDSAGNIYIGDRNNNVVRKISTYGIITAIGIGSPDFSGDGGPANAAELNWPEGIAIDGQGNIYVADTSNGVIRAIGGGKLTPSIDWSSPAAITFGTVVDGTQLNAKSSNPGTFAYAPASGAILPAGQQSLTTVFTPADTTDYFSTSYSVPMTVNQAIPQILWPSPASISDAIALSATQLNAAAKLNTTTVGGTYVYSPNVGTKLSPGIQVLRVQFTPTDTADYLTTTGLTSINVTSGMIHDSGTVALYIDSGPTPVTSTTYDSTATASSVAQGLASGVISGSPVSVSSINDQITIVATGSGTASNYQYSLQTTGWDSTNFAQPSFANPPVTGSLLGGFPSTIPQTPTILYQFSVPDGGYDGSGNLVNYSDSDTVMGTWSFSYDTLNRLAGGSITKAAPGPGANLLPNYCWSYDPFGNRQQQIAASNAFPSGGGPTICALPSSGLVSLEDNTIAANNRISSTNARGAGVIYYDAAGNMLTDGANQYLYDAEGRICAVASNMTGQTMMTGYMYDAGGTRVSKGVIQVWSCNPTVAQYATKADYILGLGGEQMSEYSMQPGGAMAWEHTNVWAAGRLLATYEQNTRMVSGAPVQDSLLHFYLDDPLGTRRVQADYAGHLERTCASLPYGDSESCNSTPTEHLFTGKERDTESGLDYFGARYYASTMGRFMSPDPLGWLDWQHGNEEDRKKFEGFISDPQHLNQYAYVLNNPLKFTDPDGLLEYLAKLLGKEIKVHIDDTLTDKQQNSLKGRVDAAINNINGHAGSLTGEQKSVLGNIKSIDVDGSLKRSFVNESGGDFHLTTDYVKQGSTAWLGSAIGHDGYHIEEFKMGGYGASRGTNAEKGAFQFQLGLGQKIGFNSTETNYLKNLIAHPESLSGYYNSPVK